MTDRIGLRARLTILVTAVFAITLSITAVLVLRVVEDRLVDDTRASAEVVLSNYLESIYGGVATVGIVGPDDSTRFFYLDTEGHEITEGQYFSTIAAGFDAQMAGIVAADFTTGGAILEAGTGPFRSLDIDPETGVLFGSTGESVGFVAGPVPDGEPHRVDLGDDVVAVAQTLTFIDGTALEVGVSNPLRPVTDSLDTIRQLLWIAVPALVAVVGIITWLAASRALHPVEAIISQARAITSTNIHQRVPVPHASDEIHDLATTVNGMLQRLEDAQHRQRQLVADASHELRSPVAASRVQLEVANANPTTTDWVATAGAVLAEQERLGDLIDDLLALSRLDEAQTTATAEIDLDDLIAAEAGRHPGVRAEISEPVRVEGNPALLTRALRNLLDNATHHADNDIRICLESREGFAVIHVDDDGPGVPEEHRNDIFERFTRLDEARTGGGAGLGLAIAREVSHVHGGNIECTESPLGGARFTFTVARRHPYGPTV